MSLNSNVTQQLLSHLAIARRRRFLDVQRTQVLAESATRIHSCASAKQRDETAESRLVGVHSCIFIPDPMKEVSMQAKKRFNIEQLEERIAPKITTTTTQTNGGGNTPKGEANGVPTTTVSTNPTGHEPPGQN